MSKSISLGLPAALLLIAAPAGAQSFRVQCPTSTITHPGASNDVEPPYTGPTTLAAGPNGYVTPTANVNGAIKCQQISGGDGYATMGDGTQTYMFSFGPLSGLADIANGLPGTEPPGVFNTTAPTVLQPGDPATKKPGDASWAMVLQDQGNGTTRMIFRQRQQVAPGFANFVTWRVIVDPLSFVMEQKMMRTIRDLAERS